jgi:hypothetical protein
MLFCMVTYELPVFYYLTFQILKGLIIFSFCECVYVYVCVCPYLSLSFYVPSPQNGIDAFFMYLNFWYRFQHTSDSFISEKGKNYDV